jgi:hypothetical protein
MVKNDSLDFLAYALKITIENQFTESGEATFSASNLLVHLRESLHKISRELLLSEKLLSKAPTMLKRESAQRAMPNRALFVIFITFFENVWLGSRFGFLKEH